MIPLHDMVEETSYSRVMASQDRDAGRRLATTVKTRRNELGWTQERLSDEARVSRQIVIRYESGDAVNPARDELRRVYTALGLDIRQMLIDLGYATRDELEMPPEPEPLPAEFETVIGLWRLERLTDRDRALLLQHIKAATELWAAAMGVPLPKAQKAKPKAPAKR